MKKRFYAALLHLGSNMWQKAGNNVGRFKDEEDSCYRDFLACDIKIWREITDFLPECGIDTLVIDMAEGVQLKRHPELAVKGSWTQEEFKAELERLRGMGLTPLPKFNFSCGHNAWMKDWAYRVGAPEYYDFCRDIIEETIELFGTPELFHLGLEEEDPAAQSNAPIAVTRNYKKKTEDALFLFDICKQHGVRPWIWIDPSTVEAFGGEQYFRDHIPTDVLISNWYYGNMKYTDEKALENPRVAFYKQLSDWGYDQVPTGSTWSWHLNTKQTLQFCKRFVDEDKLLGYMTASWLLTIPTKIYGLKHDAFTLGNAKKAVYPEDC